MGRVTLNHSYIACLILLTIIGGDVFLVNGDFLENILYTQYDNDFNVCPDDPDYALSAPVFAGGDEFFNTYFSELVTKVEGHSATLKGLDIAKQTIAPPLATMNSIYRDLLTDQSHNQIQKVDILLGEDLEVVFCYEDGIQVNCEDYHTKLYESATTPWTYKHECERWQAHYADTAVRFRDDNHVTKVVFSIDMDVQHIDLNQCPYSREVTFGDTALCDPDISTCKFINGSGFVIGSYSCQCTLCEECGSINGQILSDPDKNASLLLENQCTAPEEPEPIVVLEPVQMYALLAFHAVCILLCVILALVALGFHSSQVMKSANLVVLELILCGAVFKYVMLILMIVPLTELHCYLITWLAEISFTFMFAVIIVKIHKSIVLRKNRSLLTNAQILLPWFFIVVFTVVYMASWTASSWTYSTWYNISLISTTGGVVPQPHCMITAWNYATQAAEVLFLCYGFVLCIVFCKCSVQSRYAEVRWYTVVLLIELVLSVAFYLLWPLYGLEGNWLLVITLVYHHLTVTLNILLIFCPKFYYLKVVSNAADINDSADGDGYVEDSRMNNAKSKLTEANAEIQMLREKLGKYEESSPQSSLVQSKAKVVKGDEQELEPLNPTGEHKNSTNQLSF